MDDLMTSHFNHTQVTSGTKSNIHPHNSPPKICRLAPVLGLLIRIITDTTENDVAAEKKSIEHKKNPTRLAMSAWRLLIPLATFLIGLSFNLYILILMSLNYVGVLADADADGLLLEQCLGDLHDAINQVEHHFICHTVHLTYTLLYCYRCAIGFQPWKKKPF